MQRNPYVRLTIAFFAGIIWQSSSWGFGFPALFIAVGAVAVYLLLPAIPYFRRYACQWVTGGVGLAALFFSGAAILQGQATGTSLPLDEPLWLQAEICDNPVMNERYAKVQATVRKYMTAGDTAEANEKVILYLAADYSQPAPVAGAMLYVQTSLSLIPPPGNPDEFDYRSYLARRKIFVSAFVPQGRYVIDSCLPFWKTWQYLPARWQRRGLEIFADSPAGGKEYAVLAALTLGNKQWIDEDLRTSYASAGAMHILAVSGLHVGIIMVVLNFLFSFLNKRKQGMVVKNLLIIVCLWLYAAIVGFSPSVTRATVMFSFVLAGRTFRRSLSVYNSLAASAFFIACFNPQVIFDAGFQLSYCAVLSIVYFQPYMARLIYVPNKFLNGVWQLATVSTAAQIGTLPVSLMNFHIFPNYFLLTNICVISLTGLIVYSGVAFLALHQIPVVSTLIGHILNGLLRLLNAIVGFVEALPFSVTGNIYIDRWQMYLLAGIILFVAGYIARPTRRRLWLAAGCLVGIAGIHSWQTMQQNKQKMMIVYKVKNASYMTFIDGKKCVALRNGAHFSENFSYCTGNFLIKHGLAAREQTFDIRIARSDTIIDNVCCYNGFIVFENKLYKILENETPDRSLPAIDTDYLIVTGEARMKPEPVLRRYAPKQLIVDASVPLYRAGQWQKAAEAQDINVYNVREKGAFVLRMEN
ncbi:MAG: ComEC family competence protein [Prevotellaceae bacterium]|jgi:competence protein ComEC|nr:ComEC family competence protein [Prevotellaceae bacterium]